MAKTAGWFMGVTVEEIVRIDAESEAGEIDEVYRRRYDRGFRSFNLTVLTVNRDLSRGVAGQVEEEEGEQ